MIFFIITISVISIIVIFTILLLCYVQFIVNITKWQVCYLQKQKSIDYMNSIDR